MFTGYYVGLDIVDYTYLVVEVGTYEVYNLFVETDKDTAYAKATAYAEVLATETGKTFEVVYHEV